MKKLNLICFFLCTCVSSSVAQDPVTWSTKYTALNAVDGTIIITAKIEKGFHIYSQRETESGPINTVITFNPSKQYSLVGHTEETASFENYDAMLDAKVYAFANTAEFTQKIKLTENKPGTRITLKVQYVCCSDIMCMPPKTVDLTVNPL